MRPVQAVDEVGTKNLVVALDAVNKQAKEEGGRSVLIPKPSTLRPKSPTIKS